MDAASDNSPVYLPRYIGMDHRRAAALKFLPEELQSDGGYKEENSEALTSYDKAFFYALLDEKDRTIQWSQKSFDEKCNRVLTLRLHPHFDTLRDDPCFHDLLRRMNLEP